ncbi:FAD-dependent monooxygenase [Bacillus sp. EB600]|uniref:FAD-dependent monooxygenase n=1 Tax=Bacillus sp. EB600 TaxID=2806345 RepID=UPI002109E461|nr:FAD-dependent monooxygenase [Bacillus sp. EB600]MCQ6280503.1 FAD-dependent monooxygenase [Bacillus sp. EB600]
MAENNLIIVGGGIGGLAAALGAAKAGNSITVLERAHEFGEVGAGIQLGPNAMAVLDSYGLLGEIAKVAVFPQRLVLRDAFSGKELVALDLGDQFKERFGYSYCVLHRSDLHRILFNACQAIPAITLLNNQEIVSVDETEAGVTVTNAKGEKFTAKAVIGADGLKSNIRKVFSDDQPVTSEYVAYRGTIPISEISPDSNFDDVIMWIGPNLHVVQYPVRGGKLYNQVVVFKSYAYKENSDDWGTPEEMERRFEGCHKHVRQAIDFIQRQIRWPMFDRNPIDNWTKGNVTLLGDAAHPMLQYLAQGGVQAFEDSAYLAKMLEEHGNNYAEAFKAYQEERIPRTAKVQTTARFYGEIIHAEDPVTIAVRDAYFEKRTADEYDVVDWLYGYRKFASDKVNS